MNKQPVVDKILNSIQNSEEQLLTWTGSIGLFFYFLMTSKQVVILASSMPFMVSAFCIILFLLLCYCMATLILSGVIFLFSTIVKVIKFSSCVRKWNKMTKRTQAVLKYHIKTRQPFCYISQEYDDMAMLVQNFLSVSGNDGVSDLYFVDNDQFYWVIKIAEFIKPLDKKLISAINKFVAFTTEKPGLSKYWNVNYAIYMFFTDAKGDGDKIGHIIEKKLNSTID